MKTRLAVLSALALVALMACQREKVADNPTYDPVAKTVNAQFIINVSTGTGSPDTKQTAEDVQASFEHFRGIEAAHVLTYTLDYAGVRGAHYLYKKPTSGQNTRDFNMEALVSPGDINSEDTRRIIELALPLETNAIMVYGHAPKTGTDDEQGSVIYGGTDLSDVTFKLKHRLEDVDAFEKTGDLFGRILTGIMNAGRVVEVASTETQMTGYKNNRDNRYKFWWPIDDDSKEFALDSTASHPGYTYYEGSKTWKEYGDAYRTDPDQMMGLEMVMGEAFNEVMYLKGEEPKMELRTGSAAAVCRLVGDMYNVIARVLKSTPTNPREYIAQLVATEAYTRACHFFTYDESSRIMNFQTRDTVMLGVEGMIPLRDASYYAKVKEDAFYYKKPSGSTSDRTEYIGFPTNLNLPLGAAIMSFLTVGPPGNQYIVVLYDTEIPTYGMGEGGPKFSVANYCYPAELVYYTNSSIRTSDEPADRKHFPALPTLWNDDSIWPAIWNGNTVTSTTRSVAVAMPINYGTALLSSQFAYDTDEVEDNNAALHHGESNNKIKVNGTNRPFLVSGIMIGGVDDTAGWNFLPAGEDFQKMIYDNLGGTSFAIPSYQSSTLEYSPAVYTCTWDNYYSGAAPDKQPKVYIGLELINNTGQDIWGELNLIRNGGTFYLVGELDPTSDDALKNLKKNGVVDLSRSDFYYPPFDESGETISAPRVFMQDYVTNAKFRFSKTSLQHAYVTMPDLRAGQVSLGMSVDLRWMPGMEFDVEMGHVSYE